MTGTGFERGRISGAVWLATFVIFGHVFADPARLQGQPGDGSLITDPAHTWAHLLDCGPSAVHAILPRQAPAALTRCEQPIDEHEQAACTALKGLELLAGDKQPAAFERFNEALGMYRRAEDRGGVWILYFLMGLSSQSTGDDDAARSYFRMALEALSALEGSREPIPPRSLRLFFEILSEVTDIPDGYLQLVEALPEAMTPIFVQMAAMITHYRLGASLACDQRIDQARPHFEEAERHLRQVLASAGTSPDFLGASVPREELGGLGQTKDREAAPLQVNNPRQVSAEPGADPLSGIPFSVLQGTKMCDPDIDFLNPQAQKALAQCGDAIDPADKAACEVLEAVELLAYDKREVAFKKLLSALAAYDSSGDRWGAWFVEFLMGAASHGAGDRQAADSYYQSSLGELDQLAGSQQSIPERSARLLGEVFDLPEGYATMFSLMPQLGMSSALVEMGVVITHYLYGASLACQNRMAESQQKFHEAERRSRRHMSQFSPTGLASGEGLPFSSLGREPVRPRQLSAPDVPAPSVSSPPYDNSVPVDDALDRNRKILVASGSDPSTQARLWRERAVLLMRAERVVEAQRAINTARAFAAMSDVPLLEAGVLLDYGLDLYRIERFMGGEENLKRAMELLNRRVLEDPP